MIIGSGSAGSHLAWLLAKKGFNVHVIERASNPGGFQKDTGLLSPTLFDIINPKQDIILNKISTAIIQGPNKRIEINFKKPEIVVDSYKLDEWLAFKAEDYGATLAFNTAFKCIDGSKVVLKDLKTHKTFRLNASKLIGADGCDSSVAKAVGLYNNRRLYTGVEYRIRGYREAIEFYPYIGLLSWIVPESNDILRVGVIAKRNATRLHKHFLNKVALNKSRIIEKKAGAVALYNHKQRWVSRTKRTFLVGDAALQVKATTFGGIVQGLKAGKSLAEALTQQKNYETITKTLRLELVIHLMIRKFWNKLTPEQWDELLKLIDTKILGSVSRDNALKLSMTLGLNLMFKALKKPKLGFMILKNIFKL